MDFLLQLKKKAQAKHAVIVFPESKDERILKATSEILREKIAEIILLGDPEKINEQAKSLSLDVSQARMIDPRTDENTQKYIEQYCEKRKHKGCTLESAKGLLMTNYIYYGAMLVENGVAEGMVAGATAPTADTFKAGLHCIGLKEKSTQISSYFVMLLPNNQTIGEKGLFLMADCAVIPDPNADQLAEISLETAANFWDLFGIEPRVALLSFSTKGSSKDPSVVKLREALKITKSKKASLLIDGEMQVDTALIPDVAERKDPGGEIGGKANVLIFPNLEAANIAYKLVERTANAEALGPIFTGLKKPINDLSRGSTIEDIIGTVIVTALQS
jgi:phosphate acetyltransferase